MRIEKWKYENEEIEVPIVDEEDIEKNEDDLDQTMPIKINEDDNE